MNHIKTLLAASVLLVSASCSFEDAEQGSLTDNLLYIETSETVQEILNKPLKGEINETRQLHVGVPNAASSRITGKFVYDPSLLQEYSKSYEEECEIFPEEQVIIEDGEFVIEEGANKSSRTTIRFKNIESIDRHIVYVAPVRIVDVEGADVLKSKTIMYYVFRGAALINVVPDIARNHFPVEWKSDVKNMPIVTVESLINVRNFEAQDGKPQGMSTIFGIEGYWLIRIGDAGWKANQVQVSYTNKGQFPQYKKGDPACLLPTNEWVMVSFVWDTTTDEAILYYNGKEVAKEKFKLFPVDLTKGNECYIGRSCGDERWLDGMISEVRVWSTHRTQEEIADNIYYVDPTTQGLVAYWKMDEGSGNVVKDHSGNNNNIEAKSHLKWVKVSLPE